jgi:hypothetical protein
MVNYTLMKLKNAMIQYSGYCIVLYPYLKIFPVSRNR